MKLTSEQVKAAFFGFGGSEIGDFTEYGWDVITMRLNETLKAQMEVERVERVNRNIYPGK